MVPKTEPDMYKQQHPIESEELIAAKLAEFETEMAKIPDKEKGTYLSAVEKCPDQVSDKEKLKFLRCEVFNADVSLPCCFVSRSPIHTRVVTLISVQTMENCFEKLSSWPSSAWCPTGTSDWKFLVRSGPFCP